VILALIAVLAIQDTSRISRLRASLPSSSRATASQVWKHRCEPRCNGCCPTDAHRNDTAGNLWVRTGQGDGPVVIVAHMDEIGFRVDTINSDGTLGLSNRGGFILSLFEAKPALIHTDRGDIPGIFLPRDTGSRGVRLRPSASVWAPRPAPAPSRSA